MSPLESQEQTIQPAPDAEETHPLAAFEKAAFVGDGRGDRHRDRTDVTEVLEGREVPLERDADGVQDTLAARDQRDSTRAASPLKVAEGATVINNAGETPEQTSARIIDLVKERLED